MYSFSALTCANYNPPPPAANSLEQTELICGMLLINVLETLIGNE